MIRLSSINAKTWQDAPGVLKQVEGIGKSYAKTLFENGIRNISQMTSSDPRRIEVLLGRHAPFGKQLIDKAAKFPTINMIARLEDSEEGRVGTVSIEIQTASKGEKIWLSLIALWHMKNENHEEHRLAEFQSFQYDLMIKNSSTFFNVEVDQALSYIDIKSP